VHIVFPSSSSEIGSHTDELQPKDDDDNDLDNDGVEQDDNDDDEDGSTRNKQAFCSAYVGRCNVQAVRAARKQSGLNESFPRSDPLLKKFANFLSVGCGGD